MKLRIAIPFGVALAIGAACAGPSPAGSGGTDVRSGAGALVVGSSARFAVAIGRLSSSGGVSVSSTSNAPADDYDGDGVPDASDNCLTAPNPDQRDSNHDGVGDACESSAGPVDFDGDGIPDGVDDCPTVYNPGQIDSDGNGTGDACDVQSTGDYDHDGVQDVVDNCPLVANPDQRDGNGDGIGDACELSPPGATPTPTQDPWGAGVGPSPS